MKKPLFALFTLIALFCGAFSPAPARAAVSFDFFYDSLDPYGNWLEVEEYGHVWQPGGVDEDWAPYTDGYWAYTDSGWTWVSYEDWGGITYHYGRWVVIEDEGWCWVPDYEWAPAWVSWRSSDDHVGWAPLPPRARFDVSIGFSSWVDREYDIGPRYYNFCEVRDFGSPALRPVIINRSRNVTIINNTVNITNITVQGDRNRIFNGGPRYDVIARRSARPIQTLRLVQRTDVDLSDRRANRFLARQQGNELIVAAPEITRSQTRQRPQRVARVVQNARVDTGWNRIKDPKVKNQLRAKMQQETAAAKPAEAPARRVDPAEVAIVEQKIKERPAVAPQAQEQVVGGKEGKAGRGARNARAAAAAAAAGTAASPDAQATAVDDAAAAKAAAAAQKRAEKQQRGKRGAEKAARTVPPPSDVTAPATTAVEAPATAAPESVQPPAANRNARKQARRNAAPLQPFNPDQPAATVPGADDAAPAGAAVERSRRNAEAAAGADKEAQAAAIARQRAAQRQRALQQSDGDHDGAAIARQRALQQRRAAAQRAEGVDDGAAVARQRVLQQQQQQQRREAVARPQPVQRPQIDPEAAAARQHAIQRRQAQQAAAAAQGIQRQQRPMQPQPQVQQRQVAPGAGAAPAARARAAKRKAAGEEDKDE